MNSNKKDFPGHKFFNKLKSKLPKQRTKVLDKEELLQKDLFKLKHQCLLSLAKTEWMFQEKQHEITEKNKVIFNQLKC